LKGLGSGAATPHIQAMERPVRRIEPAQPPGRSAPTHANRMVVAPGDFADHSPFLMLAEDWFAPPAGFPTHPHRGMETVTIVLEGSIEHRDHTGAHGLIGEGDVQWMTAGKGVLHSEMPGPQGVHSLQLWLNLPADRKMSPARYADQRGVDTPAITGDGSEIRVYAGEQGGISSPHGSSYPMGLFALKLEAGASTRLQLPADERVFIYAVEGSARLGAGSVLLQAGHVAWLDPTDGADALTVSGEAPFRAVVFSGRPIDEPVAAYGPFVMNTREEIEQAFADYRSGAFV